MNIPEIKKVDICYGAHVMEHMLIQEALLRSIVCRRKFCRFLRETDKIKIAEMSEFQRFS